MTLTISALSLNDQALSQPFVAHFDATGGTIGRGEQNTLMLPDPERHISRQHARISADGAGFRITNLSSANVVTVAGRALSAGESAPIRHRDQVRIGGFLLEVSDGAAAPPPLAARTITAGRAAAQAGAASPAAQPAPSGAAATGGAGAAHVPPGAGAVATAKAAATDDPFADLLGPPVTPVRVAAPVAPAARPVADDPFADLLGPPAASAAPSAGLSRPPVAAPARAGSGTPSRPAPADDPFGAFGDFSPVTPMPAASAGRAGRVDASADPLASFGLDVAPAARSPARPGGAASAPADDLLGSLGQDPQAARAVDDLLGGPGDGADALADFLNESPRPGARSPAAPAAPVARTATSDHVHDLHAAFRPSSFDLGHGAGGAGAAAAPVAAPVVAGQAGGPGAAARPAPGVRQGSPAAPGASGRPSAAMPLGSPGIAAAQPAPAPSPRPSAPPAFSGARPQPGGPATAAGVLGGAVSPVSAPGSLSPAGRRGDPPASRPAPLGHVPAQAPAQVREARMAVPSGAATGDAGPGASRDELWQAFCEAAGVRIDSPQGLSPEMMRVIGQLLRAAVDGTVQLMAIRSATKHELRAEMTMIQPRNNNPLKFSPDGHAALELLLQPPMRGFLPGPAAMTDAMHDLVGHSIGTMAGMRAALDGVLGRFAPAQLENKLSGGSMIDSLIPMNRRSRLWELYLQHFETIRDEAQDDFHTLFGRAFLAAYEQQLDRLHEQQQSGSNPAASAREPRRP